MSLHTRSILEKEIERLRTNLLRLVSMVDVAIEQAMNALNNRDTNLARYVAANDEAINQLRYNIEEDCVRLLATQQPAAGDLRTVIAGIHIAVELERIGDHAAGIARLVARMADEEDIDSLHKLPKMAKRARKMIRKGVKAYVEYDSKLAKKTIGRDNKIDKQYNKLFRQTIQEMQDESYVRRATYLLWVGHNLERIGDRATNIAERVIFMDTGEFVETMTSLD